MLSIPQPTKVYPRHEWTDFSKLSIATDREIIDLEYRTFRRGYEEVWSEHIFCKHQQKEQVAEFLKQHLPPGTPYIRAKADF